MVTWLYDESGDPSLILDEYCLRSPAGRPAGWIFGLTVFAINGEHMGWFEDGILYDVANHKLGFVPGARGLGTRAPALGPTPPMPPLGKRPLVPPLRGRPARPPERGWSPHRLLHYFDAMTHADLPH